MKYDIFEDICFENHFDNLYEDCRGNYQEFYEEIQGIGRCIYRRYQIWISNKLLGTNNRANFLARLIFNNESSKEWKKQTIIGIIKSRHCEEFFTEYSTQIAEPDLLKEFIKTTNLFGFDAAIRTSDKVDPFLVLSPSGDGRPCLIRIIYSRELYKDPDLKHDVIKLCNDYSIAPRHDEEVCKEACDILEYWVEDLENELANFKGYSNPMEGLDKLLPGIYRMASYSKNWIRHFWNQKIELYKTGGDSSSRQASQIIKWTIKNAYYQLFINMPKEVCELATVFWTESSNGEVKRRLYGYNYRRNESEQHYGLSENGNDLRFTRTNVMNDPFMINLYANGNMTSLEWTISFVNRACAKYVEHCPTEIFDLQLYFPESNVTKSYYANVNWWCAGIIEYCVPVLIADMIYILKRNVVATIKSLLRSGNKERARSYANRIKHILYEKTNNICLLTIIQEIGL